MSSTAYARFGIFACKVLFSLYKLTETEHINVWSLINPNNLYNWFLPYFPRLHCHLIALILAKILSVCNLTQICQQLYGDAFKMPPLKVSHKSFCRLSSFNNVSPTRLFVTTLLRLVPSNLFPTSKCCYHTSHSAKRCGELGDISKILSTEPSRWWSRLPNLQFLGNVIRAY